MVFAGEAQKTRYFDTLTKVGPAAQILKPLCSRRPNPAEPARPSESGRTQIWDGRPNPAELRLGTTARIRPKITFLIVNDLLDLKT